MAHCSGQAFLPPLQGYPFIWWKHPNKSMLLSVPFRRVHYGCPRFFCGKQPLEKNRSRSVIISEIIVLLGTHGTNHCVTLHPLLRCKKTGESMDCAICRVNWKTVQFTRPCNVAVLFIPIPTHQTIYWRICISLEWELREFTWRLSLPKIGLSPHSSTFMALAACASYQQLSCVTRSTASRERSGLVGH